VALYVAPLEPITPLNVEPLKVRGQTVRVREARTRQPSAKTADAWGFTLPTPMPLAPIGPAASAQSVFTSVRICCMMAEAQQS